jgi:LPS-assembly lipoprotein
MTRLRITVGALAASLALGGCGFTPLYATSGVSADLSQISVKVPRGRTGFLLSQDLEDSLAMDRNKPPLYRLEITLVERTYPRGLELNDVANHNETHENVSYKLIELATGKVLKTGLEPIEVTYAVAQQPYAGVSAQQDAEERAASTAADRIRVDLAVYFAQR